MVTRKDVAERAGVSTATVSYVINNGPRPTSPETRARVLQAIKELGYRANNLARSLKTKSSHVIGLLIPDSSNAFYSEVAKGIEDRAFETGYTVMFGNTAGDLERQSTYIDTMLSQMVDGIIMITTPVPDKQLAILDQYNVPVVVIDPECHIPEKTQADLVTVRVDNYKGGYLAAKHILSRGYKRTAVLAGSQRVPPGLHRVEGFLAAMREAGQDVEVRWVGDDARAGYQAGYELLQTADKPDALFACNDLLALGAIRAAADLNVGIPDDLGVIGFDDIEIVRYLTPRLSSVRQPKYQMGRVAADALFQWLRWKDTPHDQDPQKGKPKAIMLDTELVIRETT